MSIKSGCDRIAWILSIGGSVAWIVLVLHFTLTITGSRVVIDRGRLVAALILLSVAGGAVGGGVIFLVAQAIYRAIWCIMLYIVRDFMNHEVKVEDTPSTDRHRDSVRWTS